MPTIPTLSTPEDMWQLYKQDQARNLERRASHNEETLHYGDKVLRYASFIKGDKPSTGYPLYIALHGGGGARSTINESQWYDMMGYYQGSVETGVYVALRGVTDTWDLHFRPESYILLERLIENMLVYKDVDPDRVYLLGLAAGGDGVYRLAPHLADRFAAANTSAGRPGNVRPDNLASLPFLIQVGENDTAYGRNTINAEYNDKLDTLARSGNGEYVHEAFIHAGRGQNFRDNEPRGNPNSVLANPHAWLANRGTESTNTKKVNTNAIRWLNQYTRNPLPQRVVWDLTTRAQRDSKHNGLWYWLDIGKHTHESLGIDTIMASYGPARNVISVKQARTYLRILLNEAMVNFDLPVIVKIGSQELHVFVTPSKRVQEETLRERGDPRYVFAARITLTQDGAGEWNADLPWAKLVSPRIYQVTSGSLGAWGMRGWMEEYGSLASSGSRAAR